MNASHRAAENTKITEKCLEGNISAHFVPSVSS
jgi:hypothetical protein